MARIYLMRRAKSYAGETQLLVTLIVGNISSVMIFFVEGME